VAVSLSAAADIPETSISISTPIKHYNSWDDSGVRLTTSKLTKIWYGTVSSSYIKRVMISTSLTAATNRLPQVANVLVTYGEVLANEKWMSLVDASLNGYNPCVEGSIAAASADSTHSGAIQAALGTKIITVPQTTLLDETKSFAVCYSETSGATSDTTWRDSLIRIQISKLTDLASHDITHVTNGQIAAVDDLQLSYTGTLVNNMWVSLARATLNSNFPCASGEVAAAAADQYHSGAIRAGGSDKIITFSTLALSTAVTFAVCYTETLGSSVATWTDTGIRLTVSKVTGITHGTSSTSYPVRYMISTNTPSATNRLPVVANAAIVTYVGDLGNFKWLSLVATTGACSGSCDTLNAKNPCVAAAVASATADATHSGSTKAAATDSKVVTFPQSTSLNVDTWYAVCYSELAGDHTDITWRDSYLRVQTTKMAAVSSHLVTHVTNGQIARVPNLDMVYATTLPNNKWISLVDQTINSNDPCRVGANPQALADSTHSSPAQGGTSDTKVTVDTTGLSSAVMFAVCYTESNPAISWLDSGIRLTVSKVTSIQYGLSTSLTRTMISTNLAAATNRLPQLGDAAIITYIGDLTTDKWLSVVDSALVADAATNGGNANNPCVSGSVAAASTDSTHSGAFKAFAGAKIVTISQSILLDVTKIFAVCYAENSGLVGDTTWQDSYMRVKISKIQTIDASMVAHDTTGQIMGYASTSLTYVGSLEATKWVSLVDQSLNANFPCDAGAVTTASPDTAHSGVQQGATDPAGTGSSKVLTFSTLGLSTSTVFAVCYAETAGTAGATWTDTGIRLTRSKLESMHYSSPARIIQSTLATNRIPQLINVLLTYNGGDIGVNKWVSFVDQSLNAYYPCADPSIITSDADTKHSGVMQDVGAGDKVITVPQGTFTHNQEYITTYFDADTTFAVCYALTDGTTTDVTWSDSGIRIIPSKITEITSMSASQTTRGGLTRLTSLGILYTGTLSYNKWISLVDQTLNYNRPCDSGAVAAALSDSQHSGPGQAGVFNKSLTLDTTVMSTAATLALCYTEAAYTSGAGNSSAIWQDSGIRLTLSKVAEISYGTYSTSYGVRKLDPLSRATDRLPQVANQAIITYIGDLGTDKWLSMVDASLNANNPCVLGSISAAAADASHSGAIQAATGTRKVTIPQTTLLDETMTFAICYAETDGSASDVTWRDTLIRAEMSKLASLASHSITHVTNGQIAALSGLQLIYAGSLANNKWISFVDQTLNEGFPCASGSTAAATANPSHSGSLLAGGSDKIITFSTLGLSTSKIFAVCYTETLGTSSAAWTDTGLRLSVSKVTGIKYGTSSSSYNQRYMTPTNLASATNRLPQVANMAVVTYLGDLGGAKWLSLVAASLNSGAGSHSNDPCVGGAVAAATADSTHSGAFQATASNVVTITQTSALLTDVESFAICYAESDGTTIDGTWQDTYLRIKVTKLSSVIAHQVTHVTNGQIARTAATRIDDWSNTVPQTALELTYAGSVANNKWISFVDQTLNSDFPCDSGAIAAASSDTIHSGSLNAQAASKVVTFATSGLSTSATFAVCYTETGGNAAATWIDSGLRITISKVTTMAYWNYPVRHFESTNVMVATNRFPRFGSEAVLTYTGDLATDKWMSLVSANLNSHNPCVSAAVAAYEADNLHSGSVKAASGSKVVTIPQLVLLDADTTFALCYAESSGTYADATWQDSYIRVQMSSIYSVTSYGVSHRTAGSLAMIGTLIFSYIGSLPNNMWVSLVDEDLNSKFPCASGADAASTLDSTHSGSLRAGTTNKQVTFNSLGMDTIKTFALCYTSAGGNVASTWSDSGLRYQFSKIMNLDYGTPKRSYTSVVDAKMRLARFDGVVWTYVGDLSNNRWVSVIDATLHGNSPCINPAVTAAIADAQHTGVVRAGGSDKIVTIPQSTLLDKTKTFAVCYAETSGSDSDTTWRDSTLRFEISLVTNIQLVLEQGSVYLHTEGHVPYASGLVMSYNGNLAANKFISLVGHSVNSGYPCAQGLEAAAEADALHSGPLTASTISFTVNTASLSTDTLFSVCYSEVGGLTGAWSDSGIRLSVSKLYQTDYGTETGRITRSSTRIAMATDRFPQVSGETLIYAGDLAAAKWISLVDSTLNAGNPCTDGVEHNTMLQTYSNRAAARTGTIAAGTADSTHSGSIQADAGTKQITVPQATLLDSTKLYGYAVCYADLNGGATDHTWRDSYIRYKISKLQQVTHTTGGPSTLSVSYSRKVNDNLANVASLSLTYAGSLPAQKYVSLVDASLNSNNPCLDGTVAAASADTQHSGMKQPSSGSTVTFNTAALDTTRAFAFCYAETDGLTTDSTWQDSGLRKTISKIETITYSYKQGSYSTVSNPPIIRTMSAVASATNVLSHIETMVLTYAGDLANEKWISVVDQTLNNNNPCISPVIASHFSDTLHSGPVQAASGSKVVTITTAVASFLATVPHPTPTVYAICYAETAGTVTDTSWKDSYLRVKISKVYAVSSHGVTHATSGSVARVSGMLLTYVGTLGFNKWLSMVDQTYNSNDPCVSGAVAAATADTTHSAAGQAGTVDKNAVLNTYGLSTSATFAVCYAETDGTSTDNWVDSGLRLVISKMTYLSYGFPIRSFISTNVPAATNRLPQKTSVAVTYGGDLAGNKWISIVDASLNSNNPCILGTVAAGAMDSQHSGPIEDSSFIKQVTVPQGTLLDANTPQKEFAVCYAETDGSTSDTSWRDSYIRVKITKVYIGTAMTIEVITNGELQTNAALSFTYTGTLPNNKYISFVNSALGATGALHNPCAVGGIAAATSDQYHSGPMQAGTSNKVVTNLNTLTLTTSVMFAVCYSEGSGTTADLGWQDSGIRYYISLIVTITYGSPPRPMTSVMIGSNVIPQVANVKLTYTGTLPNAKFLSAVEADLNSGVPCTFPTTAAHVGDEFHTGGHQAASGTNIVTIPQTVLLDASKTYRICYAETDGTTSDTTWRDTSVKIEISKVESLSSHNQVHYSQGQLARTAALVLAYTGTLGAGRWVSMVDQTLGSNFPCNVGGIASAGSSPMTSGVAQATGVGGKQITFDTRILSTSRVFAVCYGELGGNAAAAWQDSGIRFTFSKIDAIEWGTYSASVPIRSMPSNNIIPGTNRLPQATNISITYVGDLIVGKWISLVDASITGLNGNDPCASGATAAAPGDSLHSGSLPAPGGSKVVVVPQNTLLDATKNFAVCYAEMDGTIADTTWADSLIRIQTSKMHSVTAHQVTHSTNGQIARISNLQMQYAGSLTGGSWISILDQTLNNDLPCAIGAYPANPSAAGDQYSGPQKAGTNNLHAGLDLGHSGMSLVPWDKQKTFEIDSTGLSSSRTFAVCYTEALVGDVNAAWADSGIRLTASKITSIKYGTGSESFNQRHLTSMNVAPETHRLPQVANQAIFTYTGDLDVAKWVSLVDAALVSDLDANLGYNYNPCVSGSVAGASADATHSGAVQAAASTRIVSIPQSTLLSDDVERTFAVCYAETSGATNDITWRDSYIRLQISNLADLTSHGTTHATDAGIARVSDLQLIYSGSIGNYKWLSLVEQSLNSNYPCTNESYPMQVSTSSAFSSGSIRADSETKRFQIDTTQLSSISMFAVCYSQAAGMITPEIHLRFEMTLNGNPTGKVLGHDSSYHAHAVFISNVDATTGYDTSTPQSLGAVSMTHANAYMFLANPITHPDGVYTVSVWTKFPLDSQTVGFRTLTRGQHADHQVLVNHLQELGVYCSGGCGGFVSSGYSVSGLAPGWYHLAAVANGTATKFYIDGTLVGVSNMASTRGDVYSIGNWQMGDQPWGIIDDFRFFKHEFDSSEVVLLQTTKDADWKDSGLRLEVSKVSTIRYGTDSSSFPIRNMPSTNVAPDTNRFPQVANFFVNYDDIETAIEGFLSIVDVATMLPTSHGPTSGTNPCVFSSIAEANMDATHSSSIEAETGTRKIIFPQAVLYDVSKTFAVCFKKSFQTNEWRDTYIRIQVSKLESIASHDITHFTDGSVARYADLKMVYTGSIAANKYLSLVDASLNSVIGTGLTLESPFPCASGSIAAATSDTTHSGAKLASSKQVSFATTTMDTSKLYALCYTEDDGTASAAWSDSGIRFYLSKITTILYSYPERAMPSINLQPATHRLPQAKNVQIAYTGSLADFKWVSLVDKTLNNHNPCVQGAVAGAAGSIWHSGPVQAINGETAAADTRGSIIIFPQQSLLIATVNYAVCYAETSGLNIDKSWRDTYIRVEISKITAIETSHEPHTTIGQMANIVSLSATYSGSLDRAKWVSLVVDTGNNNFPCALGTVAAAAPDSTHSGAIQAGSIIAMFSIASSTLDTTVTFSVCYAETLGTASANWYDSGIRLYSASITGLQYGTASLSFPVRFMTTAYGGTNRLPQVADAAIVTYIGAMAVTKFLSLVDSVLRHGSPCFMPEEAAKTADSTHSGGVVASSDTKVVTFPQTTLLDETKLYAVCYAVGDGSTTDTTWRDAGIRLRISKVQSLYSHLITHVTDGSIAKVGDLAMTYAGSIANNKWISLVDDTLSSNFPCASRKVAAASADSAHTGPIQAGSSDKIVLIDTTGLSTSLQFAVCYTDSYVNKEAVLQYSNLMLLTAVTGGRTLLDFAFASNMELNVGDSVLLVLPSFEFTQLSVPLTKGCGSTTFAVSHYNSGTELATLNFTSATAALSMYQECTVTLTTGVTTSRVVQSANFVNRTVSVTLSASEDITAKTITTSTATMAPALLLSDLMIAHPVSYTQTAVSYTFKLNVAIYTSDVIALMLPSFTITGTPTGIHKSPSCGSTTFTASGENSGTLTSLLRLTVGTAILPSETECTVSVNTGITTSLSAQIANLASRTVQVIFNSNASSTVPPTPIMSSTAIPDSTTHTITVMSGKFHVDGTITAAVNMVTGSAYVLNQDSNSNVGNPLGISTSANGTWDGVGTAYGSGVTYMLNGVIKSWTDFQAGFNISTTRRVLFTPMSNISLFYFSANWPSMGGAVQIIQLSVGTFLQNRVIISNPVTSAQHQLLLFLR